MFLASTGVIGETLDPAPMERALPGLAAAASEDGWDAAARAIMTTDTFPKMATRAARLGDQGVTINGIAKGSGMIAPDMATMLVFIFTDAALPSRVLQKLLQRAVAQSFNCITVDGDTSTSDTVLLCATGAAGKRRAGLKSADDARLKEFASALDDLTRDLAHQVVKDGEGAENSSPSPSRGPKMPRRPGASVWPSATRRWSRRPLPATMQTGAASSWRWANRAKRPTGTGSRSPSAAYSVARRGKVDPKYREADVEPHMAGREIDIMVDVGIGKGQATVWTCDLTHGYIDINGSYRS